MTQEEMQGKYVVAGECNDLPVYECEDCGEASQMWWMAGYWYVGHPDARCTTRNSKLRYAAAIPTTVYELGSDCWEEVRDDGIHVTVPEIQVVYSVELSGTQYQSSLHGRFTRHGSCKGVPQFTCENCYPSSSGVQHLWYDATVFNGDGAWLVGSEESVCDLTVVAMAYKTTDGEPRWPGVFSNMGWREWSGDEWIINDDIAVDLWKIRHYYCDDDNHVDGVCTDGQMGSFLAVCPCGTDCIDCGVRTICPLATSTFSPTPRPSTTPTAVADIGIAGAGSGSPSTGGGGGGGSSSDGSGTGLIVGLIAAGVALLCLLLVLLYWCSPRAVPPVKAIDDIKFPAASDTAVTTQLPTNARDAGPDKQVELPAM